MTTPKGDSKLPPTPFQVYFFSIRFPLACPMVRVIWGCQIALFYWFFYKNLKHLSLDKHSSSELIQVHSEDISKNLLIETEDGNGLRIALSPVSTGRPGTPLTSKVNTPEPNTAAALSKKRKADEITPYQKRLIVCLDNLQRVLEEKMRVWLLR